jgi:NADP-dependent 3-hydroxy acid dehydrogenase YdfG
MGRLDGQVAIVTGGGTGIGAAVTRALAAEGARVAAIGRRREPLEEAVAGLGEVGLAVAADVVDASAVKRAVSTVLGRWGRVDILVNNAGTNVPRRQLPELSPQDWATVLEVNLTGTFLMTAAVLPAMRAQRSGTVVNISSMAGLRALAGSGPAYSAAKAGVNSFTESLNLTERVHGVRACVICPGGVSTPILDRMPHPLSTKARAALLQPEDVAEVVLLVALLPQRATVELITVYPTVQRL